LDVGDGDEPAGVFVRDGNSQGAFEMYDELVQGEAIDSQVVLEACRADVPAEAALLGGQAREAAEEGLVDVAHQ
jgi:hypothetical protein